MHVGDSPDEAAFRAEARAWLDARSTRRDGTSRAFAPDDPAGLAAGVKAAREWQRTLADHGWAGIAWPTAFGGRGGTAIQHAIFEEEQRAFDVSAGAFAVAIGMVAPTLAIHGTREQQAHIPAILRGDEVWCQLFSEPGAGSDLASLGTRAVLDGDTWVVNGQKVWTSLGQFADWAILLARTDPDAPKHAGITYFLLRMDTPGIDVRPLRQITGVAHFNEVFLTDVRIPAANVVGEVHGGWKVAHTTLGNERAFIGSGGGAWTVEHLIALAARRGVADRPVVRQELMRALVRARVLTYFGYRLRTALARGERPGAEASVLKLAYSRHWAATTATALSVLGAAGALWGEDAARQGGGGGAEEDGSWQSHFLAQYAIRIGGGTDEVQGNVIGERALGLPREPQVDKDVPWRESAR